VTDAQPSTLAVDTGEEIFRVQAERLWAHVSKYQTDCALASKLSKTDFIEALRQTPLREILEKRGNVFALSQDAFVKENLASAVQKWSWRPILLCVGISSLKLGSTNTSGSGI
jgi:hypothetical protein